MDSSLSVDLSNPEWWVKILLESASVSLIEKRIPGPGGFSSIANRGRCDEFVSHHAPWFTNYSNT
jgi:hypothetical protein